MEAIFEYVIWINYEHILDCILINQSPNIHNYNKSEPMASFAYAPQDFVPFYIQTGGTPIPTKTLEFLMLLENHTFSNQIFTTKASR